MENTLPGWMLKTECEFLRTYFARYNNPDTIGVEVGCFLGRSSVEISQAINKGKLYCIDSWRGWEVTKGKFFQDQYEPDIGTKNTFDQFKENTKHCLNIETIQGQSPGCVWNTWKSPIDFLFLDASHCNPNDMNNIKFWLPFIKKGGTLSGHDYIPFKPHIWPDVIENVKWLEGELGTQVKKSDSIWYFQL